MHSNPMVTGNRFGPSHHFMLVSRPTWWTKPPGARGRPFLLGDGSPALFVDEGLGGCLDGLLLGPLGLFGRPSFCRDAALLELIALFALFVGEQLVSLGDQLPSQLRDAMLDRPPMMAGVSEAMTAKLSRCMSRKTSRWKSSMRPASMSSCS